MMKNAITLALLVSGIVGGLTNSLTDEIATMTIFTAIILAFIPDK